MKRPKNARLIDRTVRAAQALDQAFHALEEAGAVMPAEDAADLRRWQAKLVEWADLLRARVGTRYAGGGR